MSSHTSVNHHHCNHSFRSFPSSVHPLLLSFPVSIPIHHCSDGSIHGPLKAKVIVPLKHSGLRPKCSGVSWSRTSEVSKEGDSGSLTLPSLECKEIEIDEASEEKVRNKDLIKKKVDAIKSLLRSKDGEKSISGSAYHTAWVALVEDVKGSGGPQFPSSLQWIVDNQLPDGSWGDTLFLAYDRLLCTLASVITLRFWGVHPEKADKGIKFFKENISKLEEEDKEHMTCGFEIILPTLVEFAKSLNIDVSDDNPALKEIFAKRDEKLRRIPWDMLHEMPTSLLFSLESIPGLEWERMLKLQSKDGSFLFCPSSTAFAFIQTKDENCLNYLSMVNNSFNSGGVPDFYPIDFFEQLWVVDRLERLGISRYFQEEVNEILNYIYRNWNEKGIGWTKDSEFPDLDDTSMGFRLLRLNGYEVSPDAFQTFKKGEEFFCMPGQSNEASTVMFNCYRASQVLFPEEKILEDAKNFTSKFLTEKQAANKLSDKWIIAKDLPGEIAFALDIPWYACLPRIESRFYLEQYGGADDVWISKTFYRLHKVSNNLYLELGKLDYNCIQAVHCTEWKRTEKWYFESGLEQFGVSRERLLVLYFLAAASIFEPERSQERLAWVKTSTLIETIISTCPDSEQRRAFVEEFNNYKNSSLTERWLNARKRREGLLGTLVEMLDYFALNSHTSRFDVLHDIWKQWLLRWESEGNKCQGEAELLVKMINVNAGYVLSKELEQIPEYQRLLQLSNELCHQLRFLQNKDYDGNESFKKNISNISTPEIESQMQELVQLVLQSSSMDAESNIKKTFLTVTKSFYYAAYCDSSTIDSHIAKVLFERVI